MIARFIWSAEHSFNEMSYFFSRILLLLKLLYRKTGGKHWGQVLRLFVSCQVLCEIEMFNISRGKLLIDFFFFFFSNQYLALCNRVTQLGGMRGNTQSRWVSSKALSLKGLPFLCHLVFKPKPLPVKTPGKTTFPRYILPKRIGGLF